MYSVYCIIKLCHYSQQPKLESIAGAYSGWQGKVGFATPTLSNSKKGKEKGVKKRKRRWEVGKKVKLAKFGLFYKLCAFL